MTAHELPDVASVLEPLQLRNAAEQIADRLVTAIALGEFVPGQRLPTERELAATLNVSRTSIREALHRLAGGGYVDIQRGRTGGAFVKASWGPGSASMVRRTLVPHWADFEQLLDMRRLIESLIAGTAATRHTPAELATVQAAATAYEQARASREESRAADRALHAAIAAATHNAYLARLSRQIGDQVSLGFQAEPYSVSIRSRAIVQHHALVALIAERESERAALLAVEHFSLTESALRELLERVEREEGLG